MQKLKFNELDSTHKRLVYELADEAETLTPRILAAASHIGELWELRFFFDHFSPGTPERAQLVKRLRPGSAATESILDCIHHAAPSYHTMGQRCDAELDELLALSDNAATGL
ncbi:hypothetical protein [Collimonas antrihumi]|uniref:hypothetical protein n=1 Tax=Collimonas antrihumi TaxID=1940615 RepID=UPI001B8C4BDA|nr:hypothetical protein [Collimonas antrihumi]